MIDSIQLALSGMLGFQRGLNVISNNVANMNTPGFRGAGVDFVDVFDGAPGGDADRPPRGDGVDSSRTLLDTTAGQQQATGRDLDLFLQGAGWFVVTDEKGALRYTRDGSFEFNAAHELVMRGQDIQVMTSAHGRLEPIDIDALQLSSAKRTSTIAFKGNLSPGDPDFTIEDATAIDATGGSHALRIAFTKDAGGSSSGNIVAWNVTVLEGGATVGTGRLEFIGPQLFPGSSPMQMTLHLAGSAPLAVALDFDDVLGNNTGSSLPPGSGDPGRTSTLAVASQDGFPPGTLASAKFDEKGVLKLAYTNGQAKDGPTLALADLRDDGGLVEEGRSLFSYHGTNPAHVRVAGEDLKVEGQSLEGSNVDLTSEFSRIILMQRGYQAASEVVSTANDMVQQLLDMRGGK